MESGSRRKFIKSLGKTALVLPAAGSLSRTGGGVGSFFPVAEAAGLFSKGASSDAPSSSSSPSSPSAIPPARGYLPVKTPGIKTLPFEMDGDTKVFRLRAERVTLSYPDMSDPTGSRRRPIQAWGFNGSSPGPTIEAVQGDKVRIIVENGLPEPTTVHWHGLHLPLNMDGVAGISQPGIPIGDSFTYEFTLEQHGTYFYHSHFMSARQVSMGMNGFFVVHPLNPEPWQIVQHDYAYFLSTWKIDPGSPVVDNMEMTEFNYYTLNGKAGPDVPPMEAKSGEKVRIRFANLSMLSHPIHLHGHTFKITEYGAGFLPESQHIAANTVSISAGESRCVEFYASKYTGKWVLHCHFLHHVMNDMHRTAIPGTQSGHEAHEMGGMFTYIDVKG